MRESILRQLSKYKNQETELVKKEEESPYSMVSDDIEQGSALIKYEDGDIIKVETQEQPSIFPWSNILYPDKLLRYYEIIYMNSKLKPAEKYPTEESTDKMLGTFLSIKYGPEYLANFAKAANDLIKKLTMQRVLVATFNFSPYRYDNLPIKHRSYSCNYLGISTAITLSSSQDILENTNKSVTLEEKILGRIGYMVIWHELADPSELIRRQIGHGGIMGLPDSNANLFKR